MNSWQDVIEVVTGENLRGTYVHMFKILPHRLLQIYYSTSTYPPKFKSNLQEIGTMNSAVYIALHSLPPTYRQSANAWAQEHKGLE